MIATVHSVDDVMTPGVVCLEQDAPLRDALRAMQRHHIHAVCVLGSEGPIGLVTAKGALDWIGRDVDLVPVRAAITEPPVTVLPGTSLREVAAVLSQSTCEHVLVSRHSADRPDGIVSALDVVALLI